MSKEEYTVYWQCRRCGMKSPESAKICRQCGADLALYADIVTVEETPPPPPPPPPPEPPTPPKKKKRIKKKKVKKDKVKREKRPAKEEKGIKGWLVGLAAVFVIALVAVALLPLLGDFPDGSKLDKPEVPTMEQPQQQVWDDPSAITNLSFPILIVDTDRAFNDSDLGTQYKNNFITIEEFNRILEQLYNNGYVLVDFDSFVTETTNADGSITYGTKPIYLPIGKKPIMLSQTMVNYLDYMTDSDDDGEYGDGFASRLAVRNGAITCEYTDAEGNSLYGDYDFVPVLNQFIQAHPDFSYNGARAILAVTGEEGLFGYWTMPDMEIWVGESVYDGVVSDAKEVIEALRNQGFTIACNTYGNKDYKVSSAMDIQSDMDQWVKEVTPILGECDTIIFAKGIDLSDYTGTKFNLLYNEGFRYFIGASDKSQTEVNASYVHQTHLMVTGDGISNTPEIYSSYFDAASVMDHARTAHTSQTTEPPTTEPPETEAPTEPWEMNMLSDPVYDLREIPYSEALTHTSEFPVLQSQIKRKEIRTITFLSTLEDAPEDAWEVRGPAYPVWAWVEKNGALYDLYIGAEGGVSVICDTLFAGYCNVTEINFNDAFHIGANLFGMFYGCSSLTELDLSSFDSSFKDMNAVFARCTNLQKVDLSAFDTSEVSDMSMMFCECKNLTELELGHFDTSKVVDMSYMFYGCSKLSELNLSKFDTSNVEDMSDMFRDCSSLSSLNVDGFVTSRVQEMSSMFCGCSKLSELNLSKFDTSNVQDMSYMFYDCSSLSSLNVDNFVTSRVQDMKGMFGGCRKLTKLEVNHFDTSKVKDMSYMFYECQLLQELNLSNFNTSKVEDMFGMFYNMRALKTLDISNFDTSKVKRMSWMFYYCGANSNAILPKHVDFLNTQSVEEYHNFMHGSSWYGIFQ